MSNERTRHFKRMDPRLIPQFALAFDKHSTQLEDMMKENLNTSLFKDIILMGEDKIPFRGHRIILGMQSSVLNDLFEQNQKSTLIYLEGWRSCEIQCLLDFVYKGQASLNFDKVDSFIQNAKSLKIRKFDENLQESLINKKPNENENPKSEENKFKATKEEPSETDAYLESRMSEFKTSVAKDLDDKALMEVSKFEQSYGGTECHHCDYKTTSRTYLKVHIDSIHRKIKHPCPECGKLFSQKSSLYLHKKNIHDGVKYQCDFCDHKAGTKGNLRLHTSNVHGITMTIA